MDYEKNIKEWFKNHQAHLTSYSDRLAILDWSQPGTNTYRCRYVFDGNMMYISGDIGTAVFWLTWKGNVHSFDDINIGYFHEKMDAFSNDRWSFNERSVVSSLRNWLKDMKEDGTEYDHEEMRALFQEARSCSQQWEWREVIQSPQAFISELNPDYWEWMYDCGNDYPLRVRGYLIGLQMASEQIREQTDRERRQPGA
ncbi:hypothetical protein [Alicyclobacillus sp. SO9]|uniref:hypothetical protein n=1 Tax=Alicyclobacillus sp. SO9 TaxID=2665646 RepID=UPI0018E7F231|nr:hypothetical protein [Alicyclobacillus sp. SO9]QQE79641.1 hypothetical protein GI364_03880 [Alicyclobacillus sp. SO9]